MKPDQLNVVGLFVFSNIYSRHEGLIKGDHIFVWMTALIIKIFLSLEHWYKIYL